MPLPFDATLKDLARRDPAAFLAQFDGPTTEPVTLLNVDLSTVTAAADLVFGIGSPVREIVHVDCQSSGFAALDRRMLRYNALLHEQFGVPVHGIVMLLDRRADHSAVTGSVRHAARPGRGWVDFGYEIVRLWERPVEELLAGPTILLPLAPLGLLPGDLPLATALRPVVERLIQRLMGEAPAGEVRRLVTAAFLLTGLRTNREVARDLFEGVRAMRESDTYQAILDEGREEGLAKGLVKGKQTTLLLLGRKRFGDPDEAAHSALLAISDLDRLDTLSERLLDVASWQELLAP